jgi:hypothetical protein
MEPPKIKISRAGFNEKQLGQPLWGLHKTEIESTDFIERIASLKS